MHLEENSISVKLQQKSQHKKCSRRQLITSGININSKKVFYLPQFFFHCVIHYLVQINSSATVFLPFNNLNTFMYSFLLFSNLTPNLFSTYVPTLYYRHHPAFQPFKQIVSYGQIVISCNFLLSIENAHVKHYFHVFVMSNNLSHLLKKNCWKMKTFPYFIDAIHIKFSLELSLKKGKISVKLMH